MLNIDFHSFTSIGVHLTGTNVLGTPRRSRFTSCVSTTLRTLKIITTVRGRADPSGGPSSLGHQHRERHGLVAGRNASGGEGTGADRDRDLPHSRGCDGPARGRGAGVGAHRPGGARVRRPPAWLVTQGDGTRRQPGRPPPANFFGP